MKLCLNSFSLNTVKMCHSDGGSALHSVCVHTFVYVATVSLYIVALPQAQEGCEELSLWLLVGRLTTVTTTVFVPLFDGRLLGMHIDACVHLPEKKLDMSGLTHNHTL